jgi:anion-transporting  ArsA/GET3 family ATPase
MLDNFGINEGVKALSGSLNATRESTKELSKSIENIQHDAAEVAQKRANEKRRALVAHPDQTVLKAYKEFQLLEEVKKLEIKMKSEVIQKYGPKAWDDIQVIKARMLKEELKIKEEYGHDLKAVRRVQLYCFALAAVISWYLTWGYKI